MEDSIPIETDKSDYYQDEIKMMMDDIEKQEKEVANLSELTRRKSDELNDIKGT